LLVKILYFESIIDPLKKLLFAFCGSFFPRVIGERLNAAMELAMEQCADEAVLNTGKEASAIAKTLIKVTRLAVAHAPKQASVQPSCGFLAPRLKNTIPGCPVPRLRP
jgi:hypothetical protein